MFKVCTSVSVKVVTDQISSKAEVMYRIHMTKNQENLHVRQTISKISASALNHPFTLCAMFLSHDNLLLACHLISCEIQNTEY